VDAETAAREFDYRRVIAKGRFRHDLEMLVGPRIMEGEDGFNVITPLERDGGASTILVSRGWIPKKFRDQAARSEDGQEALPQGEVVVEGLLREPYKKNMFTPANNVEKWEFYFPDIPQMAQLTGAQPVWVEETMDTELMETLRRQSKGIPVARAAEVSLRNNHAQYIFTWYVSCPLICDSLKLTRRVSGIR
jgi:surfeit locus 1 family protein